MRKKIKKSVKNPSLFGVFTNKKGIFGRGERQTMMNRFKKDNNFEAIRAGLPYILTALGIAIVGYLIINAIYPTPPPDVSILTPNLWTWESLLKILVVCAGIGWVLHGTGFLLVKG